MVFQKWSAATLNTAIVASKNVYNGEFLSPGQEDTKRLTSIRTEDDDYGVRSGEVYGAPGEEHDTSPEEHQTPQEDILSSEEDYLTPPETLDDENSYKAREMSHEEFPISVKSDDTEDYESAPEVELLILVNIAIE